MTEARPRPPRPKIALALSGGGSRAIAFHLGCLRGLHRRGLLQDVTAISSVSGGSVLAALYCSVPGNFEAFETEVRAVLTRGLMWPTVVTAFTTLEGLKALAATIPLAIDRLAAFLLRLGLKITDPSARPTWRWLRESPFRRWASRTTILARTFEHVFRARPLTALRLDRPTLIIVACELRSKSAFYFSAEKLHCWRYGSAASSKVKIAYAVAASAAFPLLLPAIDTDLEFERNGQRSRHRVILTDGGVYDNLGLAPFWPDRDPAISLPVPEFDAIVACRAGYGLEIADPASFMLARISATIDAIHTRAQNFATARLFDLKKAGRISRILLPYLGQDDSRLAARPLDLVTREIAAGYPTDFSAMSEAWIDRLSLRGEQLVEALLLEHWSDLAPFTLSEAR